MRTHKRLFLCLVMATGLWPYGLADDVRPVIEGVGVDEKLGTVLNLELEFTKSDGQKIQLKDVINDRIPTIIAPVYYSCPNLCTVVLNGVRDLVNQLEFDLGSDYQVLAISFDPSNTPQLAREKRDNYFQTLEEPGEARKGWFFLTGSDPAVTEVMDQIGFRYKWVNDQFSHASVLGVISPKGKITRYVYGVNYPARDVRLALVEASEGKVGSTVDQILIYCFKYDPRAGKYVPYAWNIMRAAGVLTLVVMAITGFFLWKK